MGFSSPGPLGLSGVLSQTAFAFSPMFQSPALSKVVPILLPKPKIPGPVGNPVATSGILKNNPIPTTTATTSPTLVPTTETTVDSRSEKNIATLQAEVRPYARKLVMAAAAHGITIKIISGLRTYAEQDALYNQGRSTKGNIVTNARGGESNHNFGIAFDIGVFVKEKYITTAASYDAVGPLGVSLGLEWGGNWKFKDRPHFQLRPKWAANLDERKMLAELRKRKSANLPIFTQT